jgi:hypothetical protein
VYFNGWEEIVHVHSGTKSGTKYWLMREDTLDAYWQTIVIGNVGHRYNVSKEQFHQWKHLYQGRIPNI